MLAHNSPPARAVLRLPPQIITIWFTGIFTNMPMNLAGAISE